MGGIFFLLALLIAFFSVGLSRLSERYWESPARKQARLDNAVVNYGLNLKSNLCTNVQTIYLIDNCYKVDFGASVKLWEGPLDGVTTMVGIEGLQSNGILKNGILKILKRFFTTPDALATLFLNDGSFLIQGNVSICPKQNDLDHDGERERLIYDKTEIKNDSTLDNYDLVYIKDKNNKPVAAFVFCLIQNRFDNPLENIRRIIVLN